MKKDLTNSRLDRQNILNNEMAIEEIENKSGVEGIVWNNKLFVTREMTAKFFDVDVRTISRYLEQNGEELSENGYEVLRGKKLKSFLDAARNSGKDINVPNLISHDHGNTINTIVKTLEDELDYRVIGVSLDENGNYQYDRSSFVRNSKNFGVPQNRARAYIMAFSKKKYGNAIKLLTEQLPTESTEVVFEDVNAILETEVDDKYYMAEGYLETLKRHKIREHEKGHGFGYCVVNQEGGEHPIANTILATGGSGKERNLIYQPKEGISGKVIPRKKTRLNSEGIRVMTPMEWGRLQGFIGYGFLDADGSETFSFPEDTNDAQKYKQFGNSVSIPVIKTMADFMLNCFDILEQQQEEIVKALAYQNAYITKKAVMENLGINAVQASAILKKLIEQQEIRRISHGVSTRYVNANREDDLPPFSQEEKVLEYAKENDSFSNKDIVELLQITVGSGNVLLSTMVKKGLLIRVKRGWYSAKV